MRMRDVWGGIGVTVALVLLAAPLEAQENRVGLVGGLTMATWGGDDVDDPDGSLGYDVGAYLSWQVGDTWAFRPGVYYVQKGIEDSDASGEAELNLDYIEFPLLLEYRIPTEGALGVSLMGGPAAAFNLGCDLEGTSGGVSVTADCDDLGIDVKSIDLGAMIGMGLRFAAGESVGIVVEANYNYGLLSIDDSGGDADIKNRAFQVNAGVSFPVGR